MYRACEAYSNGGISEIQYALLLSKLSETLVSLRYGELAAGDFGRSLGGSTGTADSESSATGSAEGRATRELLRQANLRTEEKNNQVREAERDLQQARRENRELQNSLSQKQQEIDRTQSDLRTADAARAPVLERQLSDLRKESREIDNKLKEKSKDVSELERKLERAESEQRRSLDEARTAQSLAARSRAGGTVTVGGGLDRSPSSELAREIKEMQRDFLRDDGSVDAIIATC
jgi:chromosome segregation ATPase